jgi:hypothetical protein
MLLGPLEAVRATPFRAQSASPAATSVGAPPKLIGAVD